MCPPPSTVMSISIKKYFIRARSMSATNHYQLIWHVILHSVRSSALWRGAKTRPKHTWKVPGNTTPSLYLHQKLIFSFCSRRPHVLYRSKANIIWFCVHLLINVRSRNERTCMSQLAVSRFLLLLRSSRQCHTPPTGSSHRNNIWCRCRPVHETKCGLCFAIWVIKVNTALLVRIW